MPVPDAEPRPPGGGFPVVALVCSIGGLDALSVVLAPLPAGIPAAVLAMQHISPHRESHLAEVLSRRTVLPVEAAHDGAPLVPGRVLVVPAAKHLLVGVDDRVRLIDTGAIPPARPSADLLLSTLAVAAGPRAVAVVLTGGGTDGSLGAKAVRAFGGRVLVQDEASAEEYGMPGASVLPGSPRAPVPLDEIAAVLVGLLQR